MSLSEETEMCLCLRRQNTIYMDQEKAGRDYTVSVTTSSTPTTASVYRSEKSATLLSISFAITE